MATRQCLNIPLVATQVPSHRHRQHQFHFGWTTRWPNNRSLLLHSTLKPSSSLSLVTNSPTHQLHLLEDVCNLCESGNITEALSLLRAELKNVNSYSLHCKQPLGVLLQACGNKRDIETGRKVHQMVMASTQFCNDFVLNTRLITMYSMCGSPLDSRSVFDNLRSRNLFLWNALVSGYTRNELYDEALNVFVELISFTEFQPDHFTLPCVIKACGGILDTGLGEVIHGMALKMDLMSDMFIGNALVAMYGKCGFVQEAVKVFDYMPERNLVSWNSMVSVFSENAFSQHCFNTLMEMLMSQQGLIPDVATVVTILPACAEAGEVDMGKLIHCLALKLGLSEQVMVNNSLVNMYVKCGYLSEAKILFANNDNKNVVSWNTMIGGFSSKGDVHGTFNLLRKMQLEEEMKVNEVTLLNVLPVCLGKAELISLKELHAYSFRSGFQFDELVANGLVAAYSKCGSLISAERVFYGMETRTINSWNALIGGYAQNGDPSKALDFYIQMRNSGLEPDCFSIGSLLLACGRLKSKHYGKEIHGFVIRNGLEADHVIGISLLSLYIHCGNSSCARVLFDGMEDKSLVSWNAMIAGYSQNELPDEAFSLFRQMLSYGVQPYEIAIVSVFGACSQISALRLGKETHCHALKAHLTEDIFVGCSIIHMYAKCGCMESSQKVFDSLRDKDLASWNAIIAGYGLHGHGKKATELFEKLQKHGLKPDGFTFIGILVACNHAGLVTDGLKYFKKMQNCYGMDPKMEHYACVVDMLGRAGQLEDALTFINEMPEEPDAVVWSSLLSSCRTYGALKMGEQVAKKLLELEPNKAENYVLLSNLYAESGKWDAVRNVRKMMEEIGLQKDPGCSWIELGGNVYSFIVGDNLRPEMQEIQEMWRRLEKKITKHGYKPNTGSVLHEVDEEKKIKMLRGHSEKLAISFGLLKTSKGATVRVCKNLRICVDCHNAAKLISKVAEREIVVRDNKHFHHFRNGFCSCGDYW